MSKTIDNDVRLDTGAKVKFSFSVTNSPDEQTFSIELLTAVMRGSVSGSGDDRVLFEKDYLTKGAPLPTVEERGATSH